MDLRLRILLIMAAASAVVGAWFKFSGLWQVGESLAIISAKLGTPIPAGLGSILGALPLVLLAVKWFADDQKYVKYFHVSRFEQFMLIVGRPMWLFVVGMLISAGTWFAAHVAEFQGSMVWSETYGDTMVVSLVSSYVGQLFAVVCYGAVNLAFWGVSVIGDPLGWRLRRLRIAVAHMILGDLRYQLERDLIQMFVARMKASDDHWRKDLALQREHVRLAGGARE